MSIFLLCLLTSNPKNLSLAGKNRNGTGKAMDLKSVSGISVWANLSWWSHERAALESKMENFQIQNPRKSQNKSLLRWLKITLQRIVMVMWKSHNLSEPEWPDKYHGELRIQSVQRKLWDWNSILRTIYNKEIFPIHGSVTTDIVKGGSSCRELNFGLAQDTRENLKVCNGR